MHGDGWLREGLWPSRCPENHPVNKRGGSGQENRMFFDGVQVTAAPGQSGSPMLPSEGWISPSQTHTEQTANSKSSHESATSCAQGVWNTLRAARGGRDHPGQMGARWPWGQGLGERGTEWGFPALSWRKQARSRKFWLSQALWHDSQKRSQYHRDLEASEMVFNSWL